MENNDRHFNQNAASLTPGDLPAEFSMNYETCIFQLPDFSDIEKLQTRRSTRQTVERETEAAVRELDEVPVVEVDETLAERSCHESSAKENMEEPAVNRQFAAESCVRQPGTAVTAEQSDSGTHGQMISFLPLDEAFEAVSSSDFSETEDDCCEEEAVCEQEAAPVETPIESTENDGNGLDKVLDYASVVAAVGSIETGKTISVPLSARMGEYQVSCESLLKTIVARRQPARPGVLILCDVDAPLRSGHVSLAVARKLTFLTNKRVLVIDSDLESSALTTWCRIGAVDGARELMRSMISWERLVKTTDVDRVDLIACGKQPLRFSGPSDFVEGVVRKTLVQMNGQYDYVIVNAGHAFDNSLHLWGQVCDGTCLVLDPERASRSVAAAAVNELKKLGCRLIGCLPVAPMVETAEPTRKAG